VSWAQDFLAVVSTIRCDVGFDAKDGFDLSLATLSIEGDRPKKIAVIGEGHRVLTGVLDRIQKFSDLAIAV
jgi:hypothetical protein